MRLNLGCGEYHAAGWVNVDLHDDLPGGPRPDVVADVRALPFDDDSFTYVYCGHVLEHVELQEMSAALYEIARVLTADGKLLVVGPDCDHPDAPVPTAEIGGNRWPGDEHRWRSTMASTELALRVAGFAPVALDVSEVPAEWPVVDRNAAWQLALLCQNRRA